MWVAHGSAFFLIVQNFFLWDADVLFRFQRLRPLPLNAFASGKVPTRDTSATTLASLEATLMLGQHGSRPCLTNQLDVAMIHAAHYFDKDI